MTKKIGITLLNDQKDWNNSTGWPKNYNFMFINSNGWETGSVSDVEPVNDRHVYCHYKNNGIFHAALWEYLRHTFKPNFIGVSETDQTRGGAVGWGTVLQSGWSRVRFLIVSLEFLIDIILQVALFHRGRLSL
jgi:hypothetical protein